MPGLRLSPHQVSWAGKPSNRVGIRRREPREHVLRNARSYRSPFRTRSSYAQGIDVDEAEDLRRLRALRVDPHRHEAFRAVNALSLHAEHHRGDGRGNVSPVFYTFNKLLWLIGWALALTGCSAITGGDLSKLGKRDAGDGAVDAGELPDAGMLADAAAADASKPVGPDQPVEPFDGGHDAGDGNHGEADAGGDGDGDGERDAAMPPPCDAPSFSSSAHYGAGDVVQLGAMLYRCRPFPASSWCELEGYEPPSGTYWRDAWDELGACTVEKSIPGYAHPWTL